MKILIAHNRYRFLGGEDTIVKEETEMLMSHGHTVRLLAEDNDSIQGFGGAVVASTSAFYSAASRRRIAKVIEEFQPDLLHIHNWFPRLSPSIIFEADARSIPVVQTLHNYRMVCANAFLYREGRVCTDCVGKMFPLDGMIHACYHESRPGSAVVSATYTLHRWAGTWNRVDRFIAVSSFQRSVLVKGGVPEDRIVVKPNLVRSDGVRSTSEKQEYAIFVGRISEEKGIRTMLKAWDSGKISLRLKIFGDGQLAGEVRAHTAKNPLIEYVGPQPSAVVYDALAKARFLVFPSEWYEPLATVTIESFAHGTPVLASDLGNNVELVQEGVRGSRFTPGDANDLAAKVQSFLTGDAYTQMCSNCVEYWQENFTPEKNYPLLMEIYADAMSVRRARRS